MAALLRWMDAHEGTAAWVQAFFSVIAIVVAGCIPIWDERVKRAAGRRSWIARLGILATEVGRMADEVSATYSSAGRLVGACLEGDRDQYTPLMEAIGVFPSPSHAGGDYFGALLRLKVIAASWDWRWRAAVDHGEAMVREPSHDEDEQESRLKWLVESTEKLIADVKTLEAKH